MSKRHFSPKHGYFHCLFVSLSFFQLMCYQSCTRIVHLLSPHFAMVTYYNAEIGFYERGLVRGWGLIKNVYFLVGGLLEGGSLFEECEFEDLRFFH